MTRDEALALIAELPELPTSVMATAPQCTLCGKPAPGAEYATTCVRCGAITHACLECSNAVDKDNRGMAMQVRMAVGHGCPNPAGGAR